MGTGSRLDKPGVTGFVHHAPSNTESTGSLLLTHGAGGDCSAPLLVNLAETFCERGVTVLRFDLPFRQRRSTGPPQPTRAAEDRDGIAAAFESIRGIVDGPVLMGGHSYGGRQTSMLCAERPELAAGLILLSYPLHPPKKPEKLRIEHLPNLRNPVLFVHGTRDPFGTVDELSQAASMIPAESLLVSVDGAAHDLAPQKFDAASKTVDAARSFFGLW